MTGALKRTKRFENLPAWTAPLIALFVLVIFTIVFELISKGESNFLKAQNLFNIARQISFVGIIAIGMTFVIILAGIDLSVGSLVAFVGGFGVLTLNSVLIAESVLTAHEAAEAARASGGFVPLNAPGAISVRSAELWTTLGLDGVEWFAVALSMIVMVLLGTLAGLLNGILIAKGKLAPFIATLGGLAAFRSLALAMVDGGEYRSASPKMFGAIGQGGIPIPGTNIAPNAPEPIPLLIPWPVIVFLVMVIIGWVVLNKTRYGRAVYAIGSNELAAKYSAINVDRIKIITYTLIGFTCGVAGLLLASRLNSVSSSGTGLLYELDVIAAVVIGGTRMRGGSGTIFGTVIGVLILGVISNMLNLLQVSPYLQGLVKGSIIIIAVLAQRAERD